MRLALVTILMAAAATAGCEPRQQYRPLDDYSYQSDQFGPQAHEEYGYYDETQPEVIGPAPADSYARPAGSSSVADSLGITTAEQRHRELEAIDRGTSVTPDPYVVAPDATATYPSGEMIEYTVVRGDTLWKISRRFLGKGSRYKEIQAANPGIDPAKILPGQTLLIPVD